MANKIKSIFTDEMVSVEGKMRFKNKKAYNTFIAKLEKAYSEGSSERIDGVTSISTSIKQNGSKFPFDESFLPSFVIITPTVESFSIPLLVNNQKKEINLFRSKSKEAVTVRTKKDAIVYLQFVFSKRENKQTVKYDVQIENAKSIEEIVESYYLAEALFETLFVPEKQPNENKNSITVYDIKRYFHTQARFYERLVAITKEFDLKIQASSLKALTIEEQQVVDELYLLIVDKKTVKLNGKLMNDDTSSITINNDSAKIEIGKSLDLAFTGTRDYSFLEQTLRIYTANLLTNMIVKEIKKEEDGTTKVLYGDTDSKPMFISYSAYKTQADAVNERNIIHKHVDTYLNAEYSSVYIQKYYSK